MKPMRIMKRNLKDFEELQHCSFSATLYGEIWPKMTRGYHQPGNRKNLRGSSKILDKVADEFLLARPEGGRFFITSKEAYYCPQGSPRVYFLEFHLPQPKRSSR